MGEPYPIGMYPYRSGRIVKEDGTTVNIGDLIQSIEAKSGQLPPEPSGYNRAVSVTPDDAATIEPTRGLYIGTSGDASVTMSDGSSVVFKALEAGKVHSLSVTAVKATGTTATDIVALY